MLKACVCAAVQSGLSWFTILKRRDAYRAAYADWDMEAISAFEDEKVRMLSTSHVAEHHTE